jgi:hypothetical protein
MGSSVAFMLVCLAMALSLVLPNRYLDVALGRHRQTEPYGTFIPDGRPQPQMPKVTTRPAILLQARSAQLWALKLKLLSRRG